MLSTTLDSLLHHHKLGPVCVGTVICLIRSKVVVLGGVVFLNFTSFN